MIVWEFPCESRSLPGFNPEKPLLIAEVFSSLPMVWGSLHRLPGLRRSDIGVLGSIDVRSLFAALY